MEVGEDDFRMGLPCQALEPRRRDIVDLLDPELELTGSSPVTLRFFRIASDMAPSRTVRHGGVNTPR